MFEVRRASRLSYLVLDGEHEVLHVPAVHPRLLLVHLTPPTARRSITLQDNMGGLQ